MATDFLADLDLTDEERARVKDLGEHLQVTLLEPLTYKANKIDGDRTVTELCMVKKVKGKHMKAMDKAVGEISQGLALVAALTGIPSQAMDELDARDIGLVMELVSPFLPKSRGTGTP